MSETTPRHETPEPFRINVPDQRLDDLDERLRRWKPPTAIADAGWDLGTDAGFLRDLVDHWRYAYDWRRFEDEINGFPNYLVDIGGQRIHFMREPGTIVRGAPPPIPLVVTHGWPGSVVEFLHVIDKLAHPERHDGDALDAFDVVVPSLPGYGWSAPPVQPNGTVGPIGPRAIAGLWHRLMVEALNYNRPYIAQGGDWGSAVSGWLGFDHAVAKRDDVETGCRALHLNTMAFRPGIDERTANLAEDERQWLAAARAERSHNTAYQRIQATRPQSLGVALTDSPVGLAAWIVEKFQAWSDCKGDPRSRFSMDRLLDNIMVYWLTGTAGTATWLYRGLIEEKSLALPPGRKVEVPTAFAAFPADLSPPPPEAWVERAFNLRRYTRMAAGGHFAALEEPELWLADIRDFVRPLRFGAAND